MRLAALGDLTSGGIRVLTSPAAAGRVIGIDPDAVLFVDGGVELRTGQPDLVMSDTPGTVTQTMAATLTHTSLFQATCWR